MIDIDAEEGLIRFVLVAPQPIDPQGIESAVRGAGYTLRSIEVAARGRVFEEGCPRCGRTVTKLRVEPTGQTLELGGAAPHPTGGTVRARGRLEGWGEGHLRLVIAEPSGGEDTSGREAGAPP